MRQPLTSPWWGKVIDQPQRREVEQHMRDAAIPERLGETPRADAVQGVERQNDGGGKAAQSI